MAADERHEIRKQAKEWPMGGRDMHVPFLGIKDEKINGLQ